MLEFIQKTIEYIGTGNIITIITFIICVIVSYYLYFKTFYRLVYTTQTICKTCETFDDWKSKDKEFNTRVIIFNNGRKTISKQQIEKLEILSTQSIKEVLVTKNIDKLNISINDKIAKIQFDYLDSSNYFVLEVVHNGNLSLDGRVEETGILLNTETRNWGIINGIIILPLTILLLYNMYKYFGQENPQVIPMLINLVFTIGIVMLLRFIHRLFFIPDNITAKYVDSKDKWNTKFKNQ
ncbi:MULTISPECIES: hypothetical protein [unclassified Empedobacter]|uniref:hypothetical protein n=1 Tax=unclassified Empedobacter TaxID=2643773 RepID=UPI0025BC6928|nr:MULTISPECIES: hypothetical protein [unclassified Empedobacter]